MKLLLKETYFVKINNSLEDYVLKGNFPLNKSLFKVLSFVYIIQRLYIYTYIYISVISLINAMSATSNPESGKMNIQQLMQLEVRTWHPYLDTTKY